MSVHESQSSQRSANRARVVQALRQHGAMSRGALAEIGLSRSTVAGVVGELLDAGTVVEVADSPRRDRVTGRPPGLVALNGRLGAAVGVEIANGIVRVAVCTVARELLVHESAPADDTGSPAETLRIVDTLIDKLLAATGYERHQVIGAGVAMPGPIQRRTGLTGRACTLKPWVGLDARAVAAGALGLPVLADNDANLAALAELTWGAARGLRDYAYIYSATGIGAGFVLNGALYVGANGTAGEIGHTTINEDGLVCECGGRGCLNTLANPDAITRQLWQSHRRRPSIEEVIRLAHDGDAGCRRVLADAGTHIGVAMANMYNLLDPELIVLGGNLAAAGAIIIDPLRQSMMRRAIHAGEAVPAVVAGALDQEVVVVIGAAAAVLRDATRFPLPTA
ncbi:ROK family protein [Dactylosporangium sp. AC04546]|uniref:ROK family transcriptional regulator n=1 Tax=Dactylosporangium sp. AC04546 TaxID=2862460 RepID=UPI001EDCB64C|nr:ROK family protein [Dactylosporangium sp. AC04546]WVK80063.1 ROK family protein [Dactylosporangium sp. AC04546]